MGCLTATFERAGARMTASFSKEGGMSCTVNRMPPVWGSFDFSFDDSFEVFPRCWNIASFSLVPHTIEGVFQKKGGMEVSFGLVCSTGIQRFVKVEKEWIFLVPENLFTEDNLVYSNVEWNVT